MIRFKRRIIQKLAFDLNVNIIRNRGCKYTIIVIKSSIHWAQYLVSQII
jgi:hypothetical protein